MGKCGSPVWFYKIIFQGKLPKCNEENSRKGKRMLLNMRECKFTTLFGECTLFEAYILFSLAFFRMKSADQ